MSGRQEAAPAPPSSATAASLADGDDAAAADTTRTSGAAAVVLPPAVPVSVLQQQQQQFGSNRSANSWTNPQQQPPIKRTKSTVYGMDESFTLHPVSLQVPVHIWEHMGGHFSLPHHHFGLPKGEGVEGALRVGRRLRRLVHVPGLPIRRNWPFMKQHWLADLCAGLTCAVMLIPQGMAYMMLASLPPIIGLHTATIAPFFFAAFGTTRNVLSVGACVWPSYPMQRYACIAYKQPIDIWNRIYTHRPGGPRQHLPAHRALGAWPQPPIPRARRPAKPRGGWLGLDLVDRVSDLEGLWSEHTRE